MLEFLSIGSHSSKCDPAKKQKVKVSTFANLPPFCLYRVVSHGAVCETTPHNPQRSTGIGGVEDRGT